MSVFSQTLGFEPFMATVDGVDMWGLHAYGSMFNMRVRKETQPYTRQANRVYNFKKFGHNQNVFKEMILLAAKSCEADVIVAVPSSKAGKLSKLQEMFGVVIQRNEDTEQRKYNHKKKVDDAGKVILVQDVVGKRVLLVDDVITTGKSILFYRNMLIESGAKEVFPLGIGLNILLASFCPEHSDVDSSFTDLAVFLVGSKEEPEDQEEQEEPVESNLEILLREKLESVDVEMPSVEWIEVSSETLERIKNLEESLKLSRDRILNLALDSLEM